MKTPTETLRRALAARCYSMSESHLSGYRIIIGFNTLPDMQAAANAIATASNWHQSANGTETIRERQSEDDKTLAATQEQCVSPGQDERERVAGELVDFCRMPRLGVSQERIDYNCDNSRDQCINKILASLRTPAPSVDESRYIPDIIKNAMLTAWNEICSDTGYHPTDIVLNFEGRKGHLGFTPSYWATMTANIATSQIAKLNRPAPSVSPDKAEGWNEAIQACIEAQPCTAEKPTESSYLKGHFDGVMDYGREIRRLRRPSPPATEGERLATGADVGGKGDGGKP
jgi:hypothetical protein